MSNLLFLHTAKPDPVWRRGREATGAELLLYVALRATADYATQVHMSARESPERRETLGAGMDARRGAGHHSQCRGNAKPENDSGTVT